MLHSLQDFPFSFPFQTCTTTVNLTAETCNLSWHKSNVTEDEWPWLHSGRSPTQALYANGYYLQMTYALHVRTKDEWVLKRNILLYNMEIFQEAAPPVIRWSSEMWFQTFLKHQKSLQPHFRRPSVMMERSASQNITVLKGGSHFLISIFI